MNIKEFKDAVAGMVEGYHSASVEISENSFGDVTVVWSAYAAQIKDIVKCPTAAEALRELSVLLKYAADELNDTNVIEKCEDSEEA